MPKRPCHKCGAYIPKGQKCVTCQQDYVKLREVTRSSSYQRGYDNNWRRLRSEAIRRQPWCTDCGITEAEGRLTGNPLTGDHRQWPAVTLEDVEVVCRRDNSRRGALRDRGTTDQ